VSVAYLDGRALDFGHVVDARSVDDVLVQLARRPALERRHAVEHVVDQHADRPDVHAFIILTQYDFRCQVDRSAHRFRHHRLLVVDLGREAEIYQLETGYVAFVGEHDVLELYVAVDHAQLVAVDQSREQLL